MIRYGNLIEKIADTDNIMYAVIKAYRGKMRKKEVRDMLVSDVYGFCNRLSKEFLSGSVTFGNYHYFRIYEPKERNICASILSERIAQHAIMNVCGEIFDSFQISDSYACRKGFGQYAALERACYLHRKNKWYLKLDVRKYFDSVSHDILKKLIAHKIKDKVLLNVFSNIIDTYCSSLSTENVKRGVPIGNLTSQYFANHYLAFSDHYIKEQLGVKCFVRYMDDMILWDNDKKRLLNNGKQTGEFLKNHLSLHLKEICHHNTHFGVPFLGYRVLRSGDTKVRLLLTPNSKKRFIKRVKEYKGNLNAGLWNEKEYMQHLLPATSFALKADALGLVLKTINEN